MEIRDADQLPLKSEPLTIYCATAIDDLGTPLLDIECTTREEAEECSEDGDIIEEYTLSALHRLASMYGYRTYGAALRHLENSTGTEFTLIGAENYLHEIGEVCPA